MSHSLSPLAGQPVPAALLTNIPRLMTAYFTLTPDPTVPAQRVAFGTSGHRGNALATSFNEAHILAITQAVCDHRARIGITGPLFLGMDTHALSEAAFCTALEVLAANGVETMIDHQSGYTPTPVISHAILTYNQCREPRSNGGRADGIVISPSHNPPDDGGFKYNPPHGGPADTDVTRAIERAANALLAAGNRTVKRMPITRALASACIHRHDYITPYVSDLGSVIDMEAISAAGLRIGIDPLGGAALAYWGPIIERYHLEATVVNQQIDPTFGFMTLDGDGKIRMDCSSPFAMTKLITLQHQFDIAFATDPDADRHGIVTPSAGLMPPNQYLAAAIGYLCAHRPSWPTTSAIGKTAVSSAMIDRVVAAQGRRLTEVPVGFKWFSQGLIEGSLAFGGEESAGASFQRRNGTVWTTDKDGLILGLLAAELTARTGKDPALYYNDLTKDLGTSYYQRIDAPANHAQKATLAQLTPEAITATSLAGETIIAKLIAAPGNNAPLGGVKITTDNGWFAARPSGTEEIYKIYAESMLSADHLTRLQTEAQSLIFALFTP
jgi:phosphoglucomutase